MISELVYEGRIANVLFRKWLYPATQPSSAEQFVTEAYTAGRRAALLT
jgi:hypothetical protein